MRMQRTISKQGEPVMDYRSPTIHSLRLLMAGSPSLRLLRVDIPIKTGVKHGYDNARHSHHNRRFVCRRTTHPVFHQGELTSARMEAAMAVNKTEVRKAVVKAFFVSANLSAMTAAIFL